MTTNQELAEQIERLVRDHITASRTAATAALARAFAATRSATGDQPQRATVVSAGARVRVKAAPQRGVEEFAALADQFYAALCRNPGATMATLAPLVGVSPSLLRVAVARLKRAGRVRAVGQRQFVRYFPMTNGALTMVAA